MSNELHAISTTASTTVVQLWQRPLKINSNGIFVTVTPEDAEVHVTAGTLGTKQLMDFTNWGYVVTFSNSLTAQAQSYPSSSGLDFSVLYAFTEFPLPSGGQPEIKFHYDKDTGTFIANRPCYAALRIPIHKCRSANYPYTPDVSAKPGMGIITYGMAYAILKPATPVQKGDPDRRQIATCDIPAPNIEPQESGKYEQYRLTMPTVITDQGEWHMPKDFDKDSYDPANAYGAGVAGPSKDNGWVRKDVPIEIGHTGPTGTTFTRNPIPAVQGPDVPVMPLTAHIADKPTELSNEKAVQKTWEAGTGFAHERIVAYSKVYTEGVDTAKTSYTDVNPAPPASA